MNIMVPWETPGWVWALGLFLVGVGVVAVWMDTHAIEGRSIFPEVQPKPTATRIPCAFLPEPLKFDRDAYLALEGSEAYNNPEPIIFNAKGKPFMILRPAGVIEFKVPVDDAARKFAKAVRQVWPEMCGHKAAGEE